MGPAKTRIESPGDAPSESAAERFRYTEPGGSAASDVALPPTRVIGPKPRMPRAVLAKIVMRRLGLAAGHVLHADGLDDRRRDAVDKGGAGERRA